jgi:hypothetical protein
MQNLFNEWRVAYLAKGRQKITPREEELFQDFIQWCQWKATQQNTHSTPLTLFGMRVEISNWLKPSQWFICQSRRR